MRAAYERLTSILSDPDECGMSALDCIYEIMENEVQRRDSNALARRLKEAKICLPNARPDTIDFSIERGLDKNKIDALLTMRWMEEHQNIIITGAAGCGKTFLACALVNQACINGRTARGVRVPLLLNQMAASHQIVETYFKKLKEAGNLTTVDVTNGTIDSGQTGVVFDWTYNQASYKKELKDKGVNWKYKTFPKAQVVSYYNQAINKDAPHPAAARLWEEYLYTADAQNLWFKGGANPVLLDSMKEDGTVDQATLKDAITIEGEPVSYTKDDSTRITEWLQNNWDKTIGN